ncbi:MAG TPA: gliding motility-associated C-terminal domain-containing protein [Chitinophagaceae bacterium]|nr:gliding motility-associated C-terminal domain-containing protein [Chitinophagaceae bacterium]
MRPKLKAPFLALLTLLLFAAVSRAQSFGTYASAVWLTDCNQSNFFNTSGVMPNIIGPAGNVFDNANLGVYTQNSGTLILRGGEVRTFKIPGVSNVCGVRMFYRVYLQSGVPGSFTAIDLPLLDNCDVPNSQFPSGGACVAGDQKWQRIIPDGATVPYAPVNLTSFAPGNYVLEVYYDVSGSNTSTTGCSDTVVLNNGGSNYKAFFSIQSPTLMSNNPSTCNGTEGSITISGLVAGATYSVSYTDNGTPVGPVNLIADGSGQVIISGLDAGTYSDISLQINGCTTDLFVGIVLSNPIFSPSFSPIAPFCAGTTPPVLPTTSNNGITGTWNPAVVDNQNSGTYTFTPTAGQCGVAKVINITVIPRVTPTFNFGTSLSICAGGAVPTLPNTSNNGITGTWSPSVIDNQNSGTYTFTPSSGQCVNGFTLTVTITSNVTPVFNFGTSLSVCAGGTVPILPDTSANGITGTWSPAVVDNQNSASYTFTPSAGQCANSTTLTVTVTPTTLPTFSFGTTLTICSGGTVPVLPDTSDNGITGTWNPSVVSNTASGTYTFTPNATPQQCILSTTFTVTVNPIVTPTFSFGTSLSICIGATVPALPTTSTNGITGTWSPSAIDNQANATYTFTPAAGACATSTILTVDVNQIPTVVVRSDTSLYDGSVMPATNFTGTPTGVSFNWTNSNTAIGLAASGTGSVPSFIATNKTNNTISGTITVTPVIGGCAGTPLSYIITVIPLYKDIFVPNVFSPNRDGKNDLLLVYSNYIDKLEMRIFNQWGEQVAFINNITQGWDGTQRGKPQPVGVYVYALKAVMTDGRTVTKKGSITLIR